MSKPAARRRPDAAPEKRPTHYSPAGAAEYANFDVRTIYRAVESGELPAVRPRGTRAIRIRAADLDAWMEPMPALGRAR